MRLIDADFVKQKMNQTMDYQDLYLPIHFEQVLDESPTLSPDEVRGVGKWIELDAHKGMEQYKCSACNTPIYVPECMGEPLYSFCPVCGERLHGEENDS